MKVLVVLSLLVACASASSVPKHILEKLIPSIATGYIINGQDAKPHSAPYIVSLSQKFERLSHICGGAIIDRDWILTAAHCIRNPVGMGVTAGLHHRLVMNNETVQTRKVDFGKVHELYSGGVGPHDIALLHVSPPFVFNEFVQPAVVPYRDEIHSGETHLYGWGQPKPYQLAGSKVLQTVQTDIVPWEDCRDVLPENAPLHRNNICSDSKQKGISACNGDSGGPLVKEYPNAPTELIALVSWGYIPCGVNDMPSIYTRVSAYVDWVVKIKLAYYILN